MLSLLSFAYYSQNHYNDLPLEAKIRIKEGHSSFFSNARGSGETPTIQTTGPEQDCNSAIPVCQNVYTTSTSYSGVGSNDEIPSNSCLGSNEKNSVWYTFSTSSSGNLAFQINPNSSSDDYDFALYDITGNNCSGIASGAITPIRCNFSATSGQTGLSSSGSNASEPASGINQSTVLSTTPGKTYVLIISNYSSSQSGYTLDFSSGTASIFDVTPPTISGVTAPCGSSTIVFNASEQIKCSTIAANGSDFTITGTGGPYVVTAAAGQNCGSNTAQINLTISPALSGAGPWTVGVVTGSDGNTLLDACGNAMAPQTLTFTTVPPTVTISGPTSVCKGVVFALTASSASSYTWTGASVPGGQQNQQSISVTPATAGTYNFTVTVTNGICGNSSASQAVTVKEGPTAHYVASSHTVCAGTPVTFTTTSTIPCTFAGSGLSVCTCGSFGCGTTPQNNANVLHTWGFSDPLSGASNFGTGTTISHTFNTPGTYYVNLNTNFLIGGGCSTSETQTFVVLPATPNLTVSPSVTICPSQSTTLTVSGGSSYTWTPSTALSSTSSSVTVANPTVTTIYSVSAPGCSGTQTKTVQVTVGGTPPAIGAISGPTVICANSTGITYSVANVASTNYTWSVPAGASITSAPTNSNAITVNFGAAAGTVSVIAAGTCGTATASINVSLSPPLSLTVTPNAANICPGSSTTLTATGATSYTWSPSATLSSANGSVVTASPVTTTTYTVLGATGTCTGTTTATVSMNGSLTLTVTPATSSVCPGGSTQLTATGATNYTWSPAGSLNSANGSTVTATPGSATTYTVIGATGTCTGSATANVTIGAALTLTLSSNTPTVCPGGSALLDANGATTYTWSPAATLSSANGPNVTASPLGNTIYTVTGSTGGCTGTSTIAVNIGVCVSSGCNLAAIRTALTNAGNIELLGMNNTCSLYFINPQFMTGPQAQAYAQTFGANLISVQSAAENADLVQALSNQGYSSEVIWIGFSDATTEGSFVWYDGAPISYTNWAPGEPNDAGGVEDCTQIYPDGSWNDLNCAGYNSLSVIEVNLCPQVTVTTPTVHCPGTNVTLNASTLLGSPGYTYTWVQSGTETFTNTSAPGNTDQITVTSMSANTFTVYSEDRYSCPQFAVTNISVNPNPTITVNSATICAGSSATLTANGAATYSWIPGTALSSTTGSVVTSTPGSTQNYTVVGMDANGCLNGTITTVSVNPLPVIGASPNVTICPAESATLTASGGASYTWTPSATLNTANGGTVIASPTIATVYTVSGSSGACSGTATTSVHVSGNGFLPSVYIVQKNSLCDTSILNWVTVTNVTPTLAQGNLPNGITVSATHSNGGLSTTPSMFSGGTFPVSYSVPIAATTIRNDLGGTFNFCFSQPVINPQIAFASIGQGGLPITINTSIPYQVVWAGTGMTYPSSTTLIGEEGFTIIRFPGVHTCITLDYIGDESYCNLAFGVMDAACQNQPICPGAPMELIGNGATSYTWSTGATTSTIAPTPSVTTTYSITGVNADGCANTATSTVVVNPTPTITVNSSTICVGQQTATLIANGASTYTWSPATGLSTTTGSSVTGTPVSTQSYTITGTDANGCINDTTTTITVNSLPVISVNSASICMGQQTATLTANGATTYSWIPGTGLSSTTGSVVTGTPGATQVYTVGGMDANGCINGTVTSIFVHALPTITVNSSTICLGQQTATLTANGASTYTWSPATGLNVNTGAAVTGTPTSTQSYTVTGTDVNGCYSDGTSTITVNATPTITVNSATICLGQQTATLTANGANTYTWSPGTGLSSINGSSVTGTPVATENYTVTGTDLNGCYGSNTTTISVSPIPTVTVSDATLCPGSSATLNASGATNYTWTPNQFLNTAFSGTVISTPSVTTTYTIDAETASCVTSTVVTVTISNTVMVNAAASTSTICPMASSSLTATGATNYTWTPAISLNTNTGGTVVATPSANETYTVIGATGTCTNSAQVVITVTVNPTITVGSVAPICSSTGTAALAASGASTYTWSPNTALSATVGANVNANPSSTQTYTVNGTSALGCTNFTTIVVTVVPTPTITTLANPLTICDGSVTTLSAFGATDYTWSPSADLSSANGSVVNGTPSTSTTFTVTGTNGTAPNLCYGSNTVSVTVLPKTPAIPGPVDPICFGTSTSIYATGGNTYQWNPTTGVSNPNDSTTYVYPSSTTIYTVTVSRNGLCPSTATVQVVVKPLPDVDAGRDTTINIDEVYVLHGTGNVDVGFLSPDGNPLICNFCPVVEVAPDENTCYTLKGELNGCVATDVVCIEVTRDWNVYIPNAFSPNGDLNNDVFIPVGYGLEEIKLTIFDRWGSVVFKSNGDKIGWDGNSKSGKPCEQNVYVYLAEIKTMAGNTVKRTGHVTLLSRVK